MNVHKDYQEQSLFKGLNERKPYRMLLHKCGRGWQSRARAYVLLGAGKLSFNPRKLSHLLVFQTHVPIPLTVHPDARLLWVQYL